MSPTRPIPATGNHRKNLVGSLETSLRRLRTGYVDLYWVHLWDIEHTDRGAMAPSTTSCGPGGLRRDLRQPAWVVAHANTLAAWRGWSAFVALEVPYSLLKRDIERELLPMAETFGLSVATWSPLAGGLLSGKYPHPDAPAGPARLAPDALTPHALAVAGAVRDVAVEIGATPSQVAIAWTMRRSPAIHPILGARNADQLIDNLGALDVALSDDTVARLDTAGGFEVGFPSDFIAETSPWVFGDANRRLVHRRPPTTAIADRPRLRADP